MGDISFAPVFRHVDWEDRRDRVQAAGPNGFNVRFNDIRRDLDQLSIVVDEVATALDRVSGPPDGLVLAVEPFFQIVQPHPAWVPTNTGGAQGTIPGASEILWGVLNVAPPDGARLTSLRVTGTGSTVPYSVDVQLVRIAAVPPNPPDIGEAIASLAIDTAGPFEVVASVASSRRTVDLASFRYYIQALGTGVDPDAVVTIDTVQVIYATV
jgi:hypothetical protein